MLRHVNKHVQEDYEDYILLHGFQKQKGIHNIKDMNNRIQEILVRQRILAKVELDKQRDRDEEVPDPIEEGKIHDKKRAFKNVYRPHMTVWNFEEEKEPTPHVMRPDADPMKCYVDGRIEELHDLVKTLANSLKNTAKERWDILNQYTLKIFVD